MSKAGERVGTAATVPPNPVTPPSHSLYFKLWQSESTNPSLGVKVRVLRGTRYSRGVFLQTLVVLNMVYTFSVVTESSLY